MQTSVLSELKSFCTAIPIYFLSWNQVNICIYTLKVSNNSMDKSKLEYEYTKFPKAYNNNCGIINNGLRI